MKRKSIVLSVLFALIFTFVGLAHPMAVHAACGTAASGTYDASQTSSVNQIPMSAGDVISATLSASANLATINIIIIEESPTSRQIGGANHAGSSVNVSAVAPEDGLYDVSLFQTPTAGVTMTFSVTCSGGSGGSGATQLTFTDGRVNSHDGQETAAVYCNENDGVDVWTVIDSKGYFAFTATKADLASVPEKPFTNTLIKSGGGVALYRLTRGELQITPANDYVFTWRGCPAA